MPIRKIGPDLVRPTGPPEDDGPGSKEPEGIIEAVPVRGLDNVDVSPEGAPIAGRRGEGASESQLQKIGERVRDGFYDEAAVAEKVASRLHSEGVIQTVIS